MSATLTSQLEKINEGLHTLPANLKTPILDSRAEFAKQFDPKSCIQVGDALPAFTLPDALGREVSSADLLARGPLLFTFYRGAWCPYCNLALRAFQQRLPEIEARGVTFVAVSPERPDFSLSTVEKNELQFPVLSDAGNAFARKLGIVWRQPDYMHIVMEHTGADLTARNGDDSFEVPIPATILVDRHGVVRNTFVESDYSKRLEPQVALDWISAL